MTKQPKNISMRVDVRTGGFTYHEVGLVIPGRGYDFRFERWQNSLASFGYRAGWGFEWDERLMFGEPDGSVFYWTPTGTAKRFVPADDGNYTPAATSTFITLEEVSDGLYQVTYKNGERRIFRRLNEFGLLDRKVDTFGNVMSYAWQMFEWSNEPQVVSIRDASGRTVTMSYEEVEDESRYDREMTIRDWSGRTFGYRFLEGSCTAWVDPEGNVTWTLRGEENFVGVGVVELPNGVWVTNSPVGPTPQGTMVGRQVFGNGRVVEYQYDQPNSETRVSDDGRTTTYRWNTAGLLSEKVDPLGNTWAYEYNANNLLTEITEPNLATVSMTYDSIGNMLTRTNQKGKTWTYEYHPVFNKVTKITGPAPLSYVTEMTYDSVTGARLTYKNPRLKTWSYEYFTTGLLNKVTDPNANTVEYTYNDFGQTTQVKNGLSKITYLEYDEVGNQVAVIDPLGHRTTSAYDRNNQLVKVVTPMGLTTRVAYDGNSNVVTVTDPMNRGTRSKYSSMDELLLVLNAAGGSVEYEYDLSHNLVKQTDPNGNAYTWAYDVVDRQVRSTDPMGQVTSTTWDPFCGDSSVLNPEEERTTFKRDVTCLLTRRIFNDFSSFDLTYDVESRRTAMTQPQTRKFGQFLFGSQKFGYDPADNTTYEWDAAGNMTNVTYPGTKEISMTWDNANRLIKITDIHSVDTDYGWDDANRLTSVTRAMKTTTYEYDDANRLTKISYPNGVSCDFTYNADSRVLRMLWKLGASSLYDLEYLYDRAGNRLQRKLTKAFTPTTVEGFAYDALYRLTQSTIDGAIGSRYLFDSAGNRVLKRSATGEETSDYDASDELVGTNSLQFRWDRVGRLIERTDPSPPDAAVTAYAWDYASRLRKITFSQELSAEFRYNADGLRIYRRTAAGQHTNFYWIPEGLIGSLAQVVNETDDSGEAKASYILGPGGLIFAIVDGSGSERYYVQDVQGTVLALTDGDGIVTDTYDYDEYGIERGGSGNFVNAIRYTGQQYDIDSGLYYLRNRYYQPEGGIFLRRDPVGQVDGTNLYAYARSNPVNYTDPSGLKTRQECFDDCYVTKNTALDRNMMAFFECLGNFILGPFAGALAASKASFEHNGGGTGARYQAWKSLQALYRYIFPVVFLYCEYYYLSGSSEIMKEFDKCNQKCLECPA